MDAKYILDTDTLLMEFSDREIVETRDWGGDLLIELDGDGKIVSLTVWRSRKTVYILAAFRPCWSCFKT